jgi:hypothetical protein
MTSSAQNSKQVLAQQGSATVPAYSFLGDQDTGVYRSGANEISVSTNGTQRAVVDASGNVGIGVNSMTYKLHVDGSVQIGTTSAGGTLYWQNATTYWTIDQSTSSFLIKNTGTERLRITSAGNVGVGTASPDALLTVNTIASFGDGAVTTPSIAHKGDLNTGLWFPAADTIAASTAGSERLRITSAGNVGIGTTSPDALLTVNTIASFGDGAAATPSIAHKGDLNTGFWFPAADTIAASTDGSQRLTIDSSGNVGIGVNSMTYKLHVDGSVQIGTTSAGGTLYWQNATTYWTIDQSTSSLLIKNTGTERARFDSSGNFAIGSSGNGNWRFSVYGKSTLNTDFATVIRNSAGTDLLLVRNDGAISTGAAASSPYNLTTGSAANVYVDSSGYLYRSTSSLRYKTDVVDYSRTLADLMKLRPVFYKSKGDNDGDTRFAGLIAEEVHAAGLTEFVAYNDSGDPDALHYGNMIALCIKTIQELSARVAALEAK